ncbi:MAG: hypothetical protein II920_07490 [Clostridia bacterium]|nr:hypothetical protein [Clostridia bacterium]
MKIEDACRATGLSQFFLRKGCKDGSVPHVKSGKVYMINVPALLERLGAAGALQMIEEEQTITVNSKKARA